MLRRRIYDFLKFATWLTHHVYFKRYHNHYSYPIPKNASIIYAANHQNSFMDAIALIAAQKGRPTWLTRASMFKTSIARFWLHILHMIPIYRTRDGIRKVSKNEEIFAECLRLLNVKKQPIGIFPEGNHNLRYTLRPLRKGITRIAFDAAEQSENPDELFIVPCGYTYSAYTQFRSNLLVNMGKPIPVKPFYNLWKESQGDAIKDLLDEIRKGLTEVMIHINPDHYGEVYQTWQENKPYHPNLHQEFLLDKKMIREIEAGTFKKETKKSGSAAKFLYTLLGFPLFLLGLINNIVVWAVITLMVKKLVTDVHFISPIRCYGGMVVVPLIYLIQGLILNLFVPYWWWTILYLGMILILGQFAGDYYNQVFRTSGSEMKIPDPVE